jgi:hypothetical protein
MSQFSRSHSMTSSTSKSGTTSRYGGNRMSHPRVNGTLIFARLQYFAWRFISVIGFAILYAFLLSEGLRLIFAATARKLHTIPFLSWMKFYEDLHRIDLAMILAAVLMFVILYVWERLLELMIFEKENLLEAANDDRESSLFLYVGIVILVCDAVIFYASIVSLSWGGAKFSFTALIATAMWVGIVLVLAHLTNKLRRRAFPES